jgi:Mlc titration factor MtfA (ptsG expression regulator)
MLKHLKQWLGIERPRPVVDDEVWQRVESNLPFLDFLPTPDRRRLRDLALDLLAEKECHGAQGLELTDEILLGIALQASLPVLNIGLEAYRGWVGIIVYPGDFVIPRHVIDEAGVVHDYNDEVLGEAWAGGPVLVSWFGGHHPVGVNVVIHEFAHKLDMANGEADGFPPLPARMSRRDWAAAFTPAYEALCAQVDAGHASALDPYGSENPGEFFAVASEAFFETPGLLQNAFPAVYDQLKSYYDLDPAAGQARLIQARDLRRDAT